MLRFFLMLLFSLSSLVSAQDKVKLALNWKPEPQFGGFYAAEVGGHFKKNGLDVQIFPGGSGTPTIQMLATGQSEFAIVSADEIILSHDRGANDVVALFAAYQTNPQGLMSHAEKKYSKLSEVFADSKAIVQWQSGLPYALYLAKKFKPLKAKTVPYMGGIGPFQKDPNVAQQCFVTSEPLLAEKAGLKIHTFLVADEGYNPYTTVLVTKKSYLEKHKDQVAKMVAAVRAGWTDYVKDSSVADKAMHALNPAMDVATFTASAAAQKPLIETDFTRKAGGLGHMELSRWQTLVDQLADLKLIKKKPAADALFVDL